MIASRYSYDKHFMVTQSAKFTNIILLIKQFYYYIFEQKQSVVDKVIHLSVAARVEGVRPYQWITLNSCLTEMLLSLVGISHCL